MSRTLTIEHDDDNGCFMLLEDGVGLCRSKSRNVLVRVRDALEAPNVLVGKTVERVGNSNTPGVKIVDAKLPRGELPRGVVMTHAIGTDNNQWLLVRLPDGLFDQWLAVLCRIVEPERPTTPMPWNEPSIGVYPAVELLKRWLATDAESLGREELGADTRAFLKARLDAQPT